MHAEAALASWFRHIPSVALCAAKAPDTSQHQAWTPCCTMLELKKESRKTTMGDLSANLAEASSTRWQCKLGIPCNCFAPPKGKPSRGRVWESAASFHVMAWGAPAGDLKRPAFRIRPTTSHQGSDLDEAPYFLLRSGQGRPRTSHCFLATLDQTDLEP